MHNPIVFVTLSFPKIFVGFFSKIFCLLCQCFLTASSETEADPESVLCCLSLALLAGEDRQLECGVCVGRWWENVCFFSLPYGYTACKQALSMVAVQVREHSLSVVSPTMAPGLCSTTTSHFSSAAVALNVHPSAHWLFIGPSSNSPVGRCSAHAT